MAAATKPDITAVRTYLPATRSEVFRFDNFMVDLLRRGLRVPSKPPRSDQYAGNGQKIDHRKWAGFTLRADDAGANRCDSGIRARPPAGCSPRTAHRPIVGRRAGYPRSRTALRAPAGRPDFPRG